MNPFLPSRTGFSQSYKAVSKPTWTGQVVPPEPNPRAATCAPDATDFFRMDPDGMRYFCGTGSNAAGTQFSMMT